MIIATAAIILVVGGGGMYYLNKKSPENNIKEGDTYSEKGNYRRAYKLYGRAVRKEAANPLYIKKMQEALLKIVPATPDEARAYYKDYLGSLIHKARYTPRDINAHLQIVEELYRAAYETGGELYWARLLASAEYGLDRISPDDPRRHELLLYKGLSQLHIEDASMTDTYDGDGNLRFPGEDELEEVLQSDPGNAMAWSVLAHGRMAIYHRVQNAEKTTQILKSKKNAEETMAKAMEVAGTSFDVLHTKFRSLLLMRLHLQKKRANGETVSQEEFDVVNAEIRDAQERLVAVYDPSKHDEVTVEVITLLQHSGEEGRSQSIEILRQNIALYPNNFQKRLIMAILMGRSELIDEAVESLQFILNAPKETVGLDSLSLFDKKPLAAMQLVDLYTEKALTTDAEDADTRKEYIAKASKSYEVLAELLSHNESNPQLIYANGLIALAQKEYATAAPLLEEAISRNANSPAKVYRESAIALSEIGSYGLALKRLGQAIAAEPGKGVNYLIKASIEIELFDYDSARRTLSVLSETDLELPQVRSMLDAIALRTSSTNADFSDPVLQIITVSQREADQGNFSEAKRIIHEYIDANPPDWRLYAALSALYRTQEDVEEAIVWLKKAVEMEPERTVLQRQLLLLEKNDVIASTISFIESGEETEVRKAEILARSLYRFASKKTTEASWFAKGGNTLEATAARELSDRALAESEKYQIIAKELGGNLTDVILLKLNQALYEFDIDASKLLLEELSIYPDNALTIAGTEVNIHLLQASYARKEGDLDRFKLHTQKALTIAEKMVKENKISDYAWRTLSAVHSKARRSTEALDASAEAYQIAPKSKENIRAYVGNLLLAGGKEQRILNVIRTAVEQYPNDEQLRDIWLGFESDFGDMQAVFTYREERYRFMPSDRVNALELALFYVNTEPSAPFLRSDEGELLYTNRFWNRLPDGQKQKLLQKARGIWDQKIAAILRFVEQQPDADTNTAILRATVYKDRGQLDESSAVLDTFINSKKGTEEFSGIVIAAANFIFGARRPEQAMTLLDSARDSQSDNMEIDSALGTMYFNGGLYQKAAEVLGPVVEQLGNNVHQAHLIESLAMSGQFKKAEEVLDEYKTTNTEYAKAMLRALISRVKSEQLLAQGDIDGAKSALVGYRNALQTAISEDSTNQIPYIQLCKSLLNEYSLTQNRALLEEALLVADSGSELNKKSEEFEIVRSDVLQADGQLQKAISRMARFVADNPSASSVRQRLVEAFLDTNKVDKAISVTRDGIENDPASSLWYKRLGDLHLRANDDRNESAKAYLLALQREPSAELLYRLDSVTRTDQPIPNMELLRMAQGPMSKFHPLVKSIEAKALMNMGRTRDAHIAMGQSWSGFQHSINEGWIPLSAMGVWYLDLAEMYSENPEEGEAMIRSLAGSTLTPEQRVGLASYYYVFGDSNIDTALEIIDTTLASADTSPSTRAQLLMMRGGYLVTLGRFKESEQAFQTLIDEQSSPLVMNNLAYVIGVYMDEPSRGLVIAKQAAKLAPRIPAIIDTVATLYERVGDIQKSAETLDFLVQVDPANSAALSRLALLYAGSLQEPERAVVFAERARSLAPRSPEVLDALGWSYYQTGRKATGEDFLNRSLKYGDTLTAYLHLAQVVMQRGDYEAALDHLRMAQELAEDVYSMKRVTALQDDIRNSRASVPE